MPIALPLRRPRPARPPTVPFLADVPAPDALGVFRVDAEVVVIGLVAVPALAAEEWLEPPQPVARRLVAITTTRQGIGRRAERFAYSPIHRNIQVAHSKHALRRCVARVP
jgi:hypothetical protein